MALAFKSPLAYVAFIVTIAEAHPFTATIADPYVVPLSFVTAVVRGTDAKFWPRLSRELHELIINGLD